MRLTNRGSSLVSTLLFASLVASLGFGLAALSVTHLSALTYQTNRQQALNLARSSVSYGIEKLMQNTAFGVTASALASSDLLKVHFDGDQPGTSGYLTFNPSEASQKGIPCSTNGLQNPHSSQGADGLLVPANAALLIGEGRCGNVVEHVQAVLAIPPWPYAIAANGPITVEEGLKVRTLRAVPTATVPDDAPPIPASMLSDSSSAPAITLTDNTLVTGDVRAQGTISVTAGVDIKGELDAHAAPVTLPQIPLSNFDPQLQGQSYTTLSDGNPSGEVTIVGAARYQGSALSLAGNLTMQGGLLYVQGDLLIAGAILGQGTVAATGKVVTHGLDSITGANQVALLCGGDLLLRQGHRTNSVFGGLLYTTGNFKAVDVTVLGAMIAAGPSSSIDLHGCNVYSIGSGAVTVPTPPASPVGDVLTTLEWEDLPYALEKSGPDPVSGLYTLKLLPGISSKIFMSTVTCTASDLDSLAGWYAGYTSSDGKKDPTPPFVVQLVEPLDALATKLRQPVEGRDSLDAAAAIAVYTMAGNSGSQTTTSTPAPTTDIVSRFLSLPSRARVVMWRESE